jgi:hypothetical protein
MVSDTPKRLVLRYSIRIHIGVEKSFKRVDVILISAVLR